MKIKFIIFTILTTFSSVLWSQSDTEHFGDYRGNPFVASYVYRTDFSYNLGPIALLVDGHGGNLSQKEVFKLIDITSSLKIHGLSRDGKQIKMTFRFSHPRFKTLALFAHGKDFIDLKLQLSLVECDGEALNVPDPLSTDLSEIIKHIRMMKSESFLRCQFTVTSSVLSSELNPSSTIVDAVSYQFNSNQIVNQVTSVPLTYSVSVFGDDNILFSSLTREVAIYTHSPFQVQNHVYFEPNKKMLADSNEESDGPSKITDEATSELLDILQRYSEMIILAQDINAAERETLREDFIDKYKGQINSLMDQINSHFRSLPMLQKVNIVWKINSLYELIRGLEMRLHKNFINGLDQHVHTRIQGR